ncbi:hypothetical protein CEUSTIGMA_g5778.t1 [Chlamydomonas eustigma]|uniref:Protein kinase domain-containing protein n=1 Tax=Chlamydomonas eustigma TaxID=1157962 RepID=A0A250X5L9_9CHLO|nr:hypothetical protein CEUSTIGMA_g5778.t1 [Chlamydomonas eustigma]|eukprot:GAX78336.1 hypothetical protein CEUSTIGMA_g5778.t1 [Chlamydomonas eustigma]
MTVTSVLGSALADFTPMYSLTHWALSMPIYMYLDMSQALGSAASNPCVNNTIIGAPTTCPTWTAALMLQYLIKRGLSFALLGLVSGVGSSLLFLDSRRQTGSSNTTNKRSPGLQPKHLSTIFRSHTVYCCRDEGEKTGHCNQHEELMTRESSGLLQHDVSGPTLSRTLPFQSFGIISRRSFFFIPISISCYDAIISILYKQGCYVDDMLFFLAQSVHSLQSQHPAILQFLMLVPVIVYYAFRLCAARLFSSELTSISRISPEEWMIALVFYFLIGRCTLDMDLASFLDFCARSARSASSAASISFSINRKPHSTLSEMLDSVRDLVKNKTSAGCPLSQNAGFCRTSVSSQQLPSDPTTNCSPAAPVAGRAAGHTYAWQPTTIIAQALRCSGYYYHGRTAPDNGQRLLQSQQAISAGTTIAVEDYCSPSERPLEAVEKLHEQLKYLDTIGEGSFGRVYLGLWQGNLVAVKEHVMSPDMTDLEKHERMALMEVVVSSSLSHPNIIQTYTYGISSLQLDTPASNTGNMKHYMQNLVEEKVLDHPADPPSLNSQKDKEALKVQIVMELCECGNLRDLLQNGVFKTRLSVNYRAVLDVALDVARGMAHLHSMGLVHSDLKASNILIRKDPYGLGGPDDLGIIAKISDFGLTLKIDSGNGTHTHVSGEHCCGTLSHMAPEVLKEGRQSMAADVYSFGILLWELLSGGKAYKEVPNVLLGRKVVEEGYRPEFPPWAPEQYISLAKCCWNQQPSFRPDFQHILLVLSNLRASQGGLTKELQVKASHIIRDRLNSALDTPSEKTTSMIILNSLAYCSSVSTPPGSWNVQKQQQIPTTHSVSDGTSCNRNQRRQRTFQPAASERSQFLIAKQHYSRMLKSGSPSRFPGSGPVVKRGSAEGELYSKKCRVHQNNKRGNSRVEGHEPFRTMLKDADNSLCSSAPQVKCPVIVPHHEYPSQQQRLEVPEEIIKSSGLTMTINENCSVVRQVLGYDWMLGPNNAASARPQNVNHDQGEVSSIIAGLLSTSTIIDAGTTFETYLDKMQPQRSHKAIKQHQFEASSSLPHVGHHINSSAACHHEDPAAHHKGEATLMALQKQHVLLADEGNEDGGAAGREGSKLVGHQDGNIEYNAVKAVISAEQGRGNLFTHLCDHHEDDSCSSHILRILS